MSYNSLELDPVGNWRLQDNEATNAIVVDSSSNSLNGTLTNAGNTSGSTTTGTKWFAKALTFDGVNDSVIMPTSSILRPANITVEAWVTCNAYGSYDIIFGYTNGSAYGYRLWMNSSSVFFGINVWNTNNASKSSIPADGSWHHVVGTYDGTTCRVYVDGVAGTSAADAGPITYTSLSPPAIGGVSSWSYWDGKIALVTVRNYALSSTQVSERFAGPELENTSLPTLTIDATSFSGSVGSWALPAPFAAGSNGTPTYIWELRDADDDSVVASGSTSTISGSGTFSGDYYLWVRASNDGGYDPAEDSVSATETASGGGGTDNLTPNGVTTGTPSVGSPSLGQVHSLTASSVATGAPSVGSPALGQTHALTASSVSTGTPSIGSPSLGQVHALAATAIATGSPSVGTPTLGQVHALTANEVATGTPTVGTPSLDSSSGVDNLTATGVTTGAPTVGSPSLGQVHALIADSVSAGAPSVDSPAIGQLHALVASAVASGAPSVGSPALGQVHVLVASGVSTGNPSVGRPSLNGPSFRPWFAQANVSVGL